MNTRRGAEEANRESSAAGQSRDLQEVRDRLRRMETRLVKLFEHIGFDTERKKPKWRINDRGPEVSIPSMETSIKDIIEAVPESVERHQYVSIVHKEEIVATIYYS